MTHLFILRTRFLCQPHGSDGCHVEIHFINYYIVFCFMVFFFQRNYFLSAISFCINGIGHMYFDIGYVCRY